MLGLGKVAGSGINAVGLERLKPLINQQAAMRNREQITESLFTGERGHVGAEGLVPTEVVNQGEVMQLHGMSASLAGTWRGAHVTHMAPCARTHVTHVAYVALVMCSSVLASWRG